MNDSSKVCPEQIKGVNRSAVYFSNLQGET